MATLPPHAEAWPSRTAETAAETSAAFRFFSVDPQLGRFVSYLYASYVPRSFNVRFSGYRVPELAPQLVFVVEEGREFPGGLPLGDGRRASLFLQPAHLKTSKVPATLREAVGASLRPEGLRLLMPQGAGNLGSEPRIPLERLWGERGRELLERLAAQPSADRRVALLQAVLSERALAMGAPHATASHALRLIEGAHGDVLIEEVAETCGVSTRTLHTLLTNEVGLGPKQVARIARVRRALELIRAAAGSLCNISLLSAFSDQAHLSREFRRLVGVTPRALARQIRAHDETNPGYTTDSELLSTGLLVVPRNVAEPAADTSLLPTGSS
jgi:AraC-like DNA-binding protein